MKREVRELVALAKRHGATIRPSGGGGHYIIRFPNGQSVTIGSSPSDQRAMENARHHVERVIREMERYEV